MFIKDQCDFLLSDYFIAACIEHYCELDCRVEIRAWSAI